jgi:hypothetical protein
MAALFAGTAALLKFKKDSGDGGNNLWCQIFYQEFLLFYFYYLWD